MQKFVIIVFLSVLAVSLARPADNTPTTVAAGVPYNEEIVVESSLNIRTKDPKNRQKRQFGGQFGQSSALANANAYNQYGGPGGFGANAANAGAQSFQTQGALGGFGASAANSGSQGFHAGPNGLQGSAGMSGSQTYNLPGGKNINLAYGQGFSHANGVGSGSNTNSLTYSK